jgi:hypothetical protein
LKRDWGFVAIFSSLYAVAIVSWFPIEAPRPQLALGLQALWHPGVLLNLQALWLGIVWFMGRSTVTAAHLSFYVVRARI